jgi:glyoxylase-like metal-dependent hydrolase (beta-lactamase superfamily II)
MCLIRSLLALALTAATPASAGGFRIHRFASGEASRFASSYWFLTERGSVLVDAPFLASEAGALKAELASAGATPVGAAILTSGRSELSWGAAALVSPGTRVWGSRATIATLEADFARERERLLRSGVPFSEMPRATPRVTNPFTGSLNLGFEGYTLRLFEAGEPGGPYATVVFVPETGELFAGGLVWNRVHPVTDGADLGAWRRALAGLKRLGARLVYPGHGEPGTADLLDRMSDYLGGVEEAVRPFASRGSLTSRDVSAVRQAIVRRHREWLLPAALDAGIRAQHARLRRLLAGGE